MLCVQSLACAVILTTAIPLIPPLDHGTDTIPLMLMYVAFDIDLQSPYGCVCERAHVVVCVSCSHCIDKSEKADDVPTRLGLLSGFVTEFIFNNVSRGLFEEHKLLYSFLVATSILRHPSR